MAMTKKELKEWQGKIDALNERLSQEIEWNAFRRTDPVKRDVAPPDQGFGYSYSYGWDYNDYTQSVQYCWSSSVTHGNIDEGKTVDPIRSNGRQGRRSLYSTKGKALRALRHVIEKKAAKDLGRIDQLILKELTEGE